MCGLSLVAASGGHSSSWCAGLSLSRPLLLRSTSSRCSGSVVVAHGPSCSAACGIFPDQGSNPCPLHWQADSQPLRHQGSPRKTLKYHFWIWWRPNEIGRENVIIPHYKWGNRVTDRDGFGMTFQGLDESLTVDHCCLGDGQASRQGPRPLWWKRATNKPTIMQNRDALTSKELQSDVEAPG